MRGGEETSPALLTDLSNVLDYPQHDLLIAKLHAYVIKKGSLNLLLSYLKNRKQRVLLDNTHSNILSGVPQSYYGTLFQMNIKLLNQLHILRQN